MVVALCAPVASAATSASCSSSSSRSHAAARMRCPSARLPSRHLYNHSRRSILVQASSDKSKQQSGQAQAQVAAADGAGALTAAASTSSSNGSSAYLDSLARNLILGVGAGVACEALHVMMRLLSLAEQQGGLTTLLANWTSATIHQLAPMFVMDHAVAIGMWALLYAIEAAAIGSAVLSHVGDRPAGYPSPQEASMFQRLSSLPKMLFPARLQPVNHALVNTLDSVHKTVKSKSKMTADASAVEAVAAAAATAIIAEVTQAKAAAAEPPAAPAAGDAANASTVLAEPPTIAAGAPSSETIERAKSNLPKSLEDVLNDIEAKARAAPEAPVKEPKALPKPKEKRHQRAGDEKLSRRQKELRDRKSYLKNFWYAAALSEAVTDKPLGVDILGTRVTLFRDEEGKVVCVDDTCPHRGAPLSMGWTATDKDTGHKCVVCPYHGWAFDKTGHLRDVPSADKGTWPKRPIIGSYPVEERGGFVWLFYGSKSMPAEERPPIPSIPELEDPAWRAVYGEIEFECGHWGVFENAIDMAHIHYLHGNSFGNAEQPKVMDMATTRDTFSTECTFRIHNKPVSKLWEWTAVPSVPVTAKAMLPSTSAVTITLGGGVQMITFVNTVPISETRAINRFCLIRNFALWPGFDFWARKNMYKILGEDKVMVDKLAAERLPVEYSLAPDAPQIAFRKLRQDWIDMGYGVPPESELPRQGLLPREYQ